MNFCHFRPPLQNLSGNPWKIHYWPLPGKNPSDAHVCSLNSNAHYPDFVVKNSDCLRNVKANEPRSFYEISVYTLDIRRWRLDYSSVWLVNMVMPT